MTKESIGIVLINDDPDDVSLLRQCLASASETKYRVTVKRTGAKGIHACLAPGARRPDCVIIDLHLPDMSGLDVLNQLKNGAGEMKFPVVLFIDSGDECKAATAALRAGAQDYIAKSWLTADGLACAVENAIERFKLREKLHKKRVELERQHREFRALIENVPNIITRIDRDLKHMYINTAIERVTGLAPEAFLGKTSREAGLPAEFCDSWEAVLKEAVVGGSELTYNFDYQTPLGPRSYQARLIPQFSATGEVDSVLAVLTDVTHGKLAEEALRTGEEHLRNVIDRLLAFVGVSTPEGILVEANKPALEAASLTPGDVLGKPFEETYWWSYAPKAQANLRRAIDCAAQGEAVRYDALIRTGKDRFMTIDFMIAPLVDSRGKVTHLIHSGVDITERKRGEEALRKSAARERARSAELQAVLRATPAAIWIAQDPECRRITGNPASYKLLELPEKANISATADAENPAQRNFREFRNGTPIPPHDLPMQRAASRGIESQGTELTLRFEDGRERHIYGNATPLRDADGTVYGAISAFIDITRLKETEEALRHSEKRFRRFATSDIIGIVFADVHGRLNDVNNEYLRIIGYTREQFEASRIRWTEITPPEWRPADEKGVAEARSTGSCSHYEKEYIRRDGSRVPVLIGYTLLDESNDDLVAFILDISERKRSEQIRARLAAIVESSEDAIVSKTLDGVIQSWNAGAERLFGYTQQEAIGQHITLIIPPERQDEERTILDRLCRREWVEHFETVRVAKNGRRLDVSLTVSPICNDAGRVIGASKIARDITERKRGENALRESEARYREAAIEAALNAEANAKFRAFFEQGTNFAGVLALDGTVVEANRLCLDACGFVSEEVLGKPFWECGWWNRSPALMDMVRAASLQAAGGRLFRTESSYFIADGTERVVDLILAPVTDEVGHILFVAATGTDVTERRAMEDALRQQGRRKDEFLAMLAHELRNPLAAIRTAVHILVLKGPLQPELKWGCEVIERQAKHLTRLIEDLLDVSRISTGKIQLRLVPADFRQVVSRAAESVWPLMTAKQHELTIDLPPRPLSVLADPARLEQVVSNLLTNAAKYTDNQGTITLTTAQEGSTIALRLRDNGIGISPEMLPHIFDLYTQVDGNLARSLGGLGIGLTLVKMLVELHGGSVSAASEGPGKGSEFTIRLPALNAPSEDEAQEGRFLPRPTHRPWRPRVLVVDDNVDMALGLALLIETSGHEVKTAHEGSSALEIARQFRPEFVLLDIGMPGMNGYELAEAFKNDPVLREATLIAISGYGQQHDRARARAAGFDHHLIKPVELEILLPILGERQASENPQSNSTRNEDDAGT
jgi:PAS domain S-box-containing protein